MPTGDIGRWGELLAIAAEHSSAASFPRERNQDLVGEARLGLLYALAR